MRRAGLRGRAALPRRARTTNSRHGCPIGPNRRARNFEAAAPGQAWLADLTCIPTGEGWSCLPAILGMHTRRIVGWSMRQTLHTEIALDARNMAVERQRPAPGLILHSDRGIQQAAEACRSALARWGIRPSISRNGDCRDNAPIESLPHLQNRACRSPLRHQRPGAARPVWIHRGDPRREKISTLRSSTDSIRPRNCTASLSGGRFSPKPARPDDWPMVSHDLARQYGSVRSAVWAGRR